MALLLMEGFDLYVAADASKRGLDAINSMVTGRFGTLQAAATNSTVTKLLKQVSTDTVIMQIAYQATAQTAPVILMCGKQGGSFQFTLTYTPSSNLFKLYRGSSTGTLIATSGIVSMPVSSWHFIELIVKISATVGTCAVGLNGSNVLTASSLNTLATSSASIDRAGFGGGASIDWFDDWVVLDNSGARLNASIGDVVSEPHFPTSDGYHHDYTPSTGTVHFSLVDESTPNTTDSLTSGTLNDTETFGMDDVDTSASILAIQFSAAISKTASGTRAVSPVVRQGSTDYVGASMSPLTTEQFLTQIMEVNPATSAAFTASDFNADEFGLKTTT